MKYEELLRDTYKKLTKVEQLVAIHELENEGAIMITLKNVNEALTAAIDYIED